MADDCAATSEHATANEMGVVEVEGTEWKGGFFCIMDGSDLQPKAAATVDQGRFAVCMFGMAAFSADSSILLVEKAFVILNAAKNPEGYWGAQEA